MRVPSLRFVGRGRRLVANVATGAAVVGAGIFLLAQPIATLRHVRETRFGRIAATAADSIDDVQRARHPVLAPDSATILVFLDAACLECRMNAALYAEFATWASIQNGAVRILLPNDERAAAQFGRLAGADPAAVFAAPDWHQRLGILQTPSFVLLDHGGKIRGRWLGQTPTHLALLNALGRFEAPAGRRPIAAAAIAAGNSQFTHGRSR